MYPKFCGIFFQLYPTHSRSVYDPTGMILAILYNNVPHMLHAKYQPNWHSGSGWLVGCFGFNGLLRQYFSLYQAVSQRERGRKRGERIEESKKIQTTPYPHLLQAQ